MYEKLENDFGLILAQNGFDVEVINKVKNCLSIAARGYTVTQACTALEVYDGGIPKLLQIYLLDLKSQNYSDGTLTNIKTCLTNFFNTVNKSPENVESNDIKAYILMYNKINNKSVKNCTLEKYRQMICCFFKWMVDEEYMEKDITRKIKSIKYDKEFRIALTKDQLELLRDACETTEERMMIELMFSTGMRVGELCSVTIDKIDWNNRTIKVYGEKTNTWREVFLSSSATLYLSKYLKERDFESPYILVSMRGHHNITPASVRRKLKKIADRVPLEVTPHVMRHTFATHAVMNGMPIEVVSKILGHASIQTTMGYVDLDDTEIKALHGKFIS